MDVSPGVRRKRGRAVNPKWRLSVLNVRQHISSLAKSYRRLGAPWKREPRLVLKGISCRDKTVLQRIQCNGPVEARSLMQHDNSEENNLLHSRKKVIPTFTLTYVTKIEYK